MQKMEDRGQKLTLSNNINQVGTQNYEEKNQKTPNYEIQTSSDEPDNHSIWVFFPEGFHLPVILIILSI